MHLLGNFNANELRRRLKQQAKLNTQKIGLAPEKGWQERNWKYLAQVLFPTIFQPRDRTRPHGDLRPHPNDAAALTWIGHATFFLQTPSQNIVIDPNWAKWLGPVKRVRLPGVELKDLPEVHTVLVSHAHFDHLHLPSLTKMKGKHTIILPLGVGRLVRNAAFQQIIELDDWESVSVRGIKYTLTPARHWGARFIHDTYRKFGGWLIETGDYTFYHAGDSAMFEGFHEIGQLADIDLAMLPIGAYDPPSGRSVHMNPEEALEAFLMTGAKRAVPMHYGTFPLSNEPLWEPIARLITAARAADALSRLDFLTEGLPLRLPLKKTLPATVPTPNSR